MGNEVDDFLEHYGVKGMKWGIRKDRDGVPRRTNREARKDAEEFARAKMFYGQGAGTRRKLIRESVAAKQKRDPAYAKAFNRYLDEQDMSRHASKARSERGRTDRKDRTKKRAGYVARRLTGEMGTQAAFVAAGFAGVAFVKSPKGQATLRKASKKFNDLVDQKKRERGAKYINDLLNRM